MFVSDAMHVRVGAARTVEIGVHVHVLGDLGEALRALLLADLLELVQQYCVGLSGAPRGIIRAHRPSCMFVLRSSARLCSSP